MEFFAPGHFRSPEEFREHLRRVAPLMDLDPELLGAFGPLAEPLSLGRRTCGNRFAVQPMEGWDAQPDGSPSTLTIRRWRRFGRSGAKLIWGGEAFAVREDGRAHPHQLCFRSDDTTRWALESLRDALLEGHREQGESVEDLCMGLQLTHSGRYARPEGAPAPRIAFQHPVLDPKCPAVDAASVLTDGELEAIGESFVRTARAAWDVGFDFVDLKSCHGYLLHELLSARVRQGPYGGSLLGRTQLLRLILGEVRRACPGMDVGVRLSYGDTFPLTRDPESLVGTQRDWDQHLPYIYGFGQDASDPRRMDPSEPLEVLSLLARLRVRLVNLSLGTAYTCPHWVRPAAYPPSDGYLAPEDPLLGVQRHLAAVREVRERLPELILVGSGYSYLQEYLPHVAQHEVRLGHVHSVGLGRLMLTYPELPLHVVRGEPIETRRLCRTFSDCTSGPRRGFVSGCYPLDPEYRQRPEASELRRTRLKPPRNDAT